MKIKLLLTATVLISFIYLFNSSDAQAAAITSAQTGNWSATSTWTGGVVPGNGDTVTLNHAVIADTSLTVGTSPNSTTTYVTTINSPGSLTIATGTVFSMRGNMLLNNGGVIIGAGATFAFDSSQPGAVSYRVAINNYYQTNNKFTANGTSTNHSIITSNTLNGYFELNGYLAMQFDLNYTDISNLGSSTTPAMIGSLVSVTAPRFLFNNVTVSNSGPIKVTITAGDSNVRILDSVFDSSLGSYALDVHSAGANTTGTREIKRNYFDKLYGNPAGQGSGTGITFTHNLFANSVGFLGSTLWAQFENNVIVKPIQNSINFSSALMKDVFLVTTFQGSNPQGFFPSGSAINQEIDGLICQATRTATVDIECIGAAGSATSTTKTVRNSLVLRASDPITGLPNTLSSGALYVGVINSGAKYEYYHNTYPGDATSSISSAIWLNHPGFNVATDTISVFKSNLMWDTVTNRAQHTYFSQSPVNYDIMTPSGTSHNAASMFAPSTFPGSTGTPYGIPMTSTPGSNDVNGQDPSFVDITRNFEGFATVYGQPRSTSSTITVLRADLANRIPELLAWVRAGFAPTNIALKAVAHDGGDIGAVSVIDTTVPTVSVTVPAASAIVFGSSVAVTATATDAFGVSGVKFYYATSSALTMIGSEIISTSSPNTYTTSWDASVLVNGAYSLYAVARDAAGNVATSSAVTITVNNDTTPPVRSGASPSTQQAAGTTEVTLSVVTDETATCKYGQTANTAFASIASTFANTAATTHTTTVSSLSNGSTYTYYVRCQDSIGNTNTDDYPISFSVASPNSGGTGGGGAVYVFFTNISVSSTTPTSATISWQSSVPISSEIHYGTTTTYGLIKFGSAAQISQQVVLENLLPNTAYHFRIKQSGLSNYSADMTFVTSFLPGNPSPTTTPSTTPPTLPLPAVPTPSPVSVVRLVKDGVTFYLIENNERRGVTSPGILFSHGFEFKDAQSISDTEKALPLGRYILPGDGAVVKSPVSSTVYLISQGKKYGFTSGKVFTDLGFKFVNVLVVTAPELESMAEGELISSGQSRHLPGVHILEKGIVYWISAAGLRHPYPSLDIYNSWNKDDDFSQVVAANAEDLKLPVGDMVTERRF